MRKKINDEEKLIVSNFFENMINVKKYDNDIIMKYPSLVKPYADGSILKVINDYYLEESEYELFKQSINNYLVNYYKKILLINDELKSRYYVKTNPHDSSQDNYVLNGSLVLKINKLIDYNGNLPEQLELYEKFDNYLKSIENEISGIINVPVKILSTDIDVPIKK